MSGFLRLWLFLLLRRQSMRLPLRDHGFLLLQGLCLFCVNYYFVYVSELTLTSGLVAVVFSLLMLMNVVNGALFMQQPIRPQVLMGGLLGMLGMLAVFWRELDASVPTPILQGSGLAPGSAQPGPAIVEYPNTTVVVRPDHRMHVDEVGNLLLSLPEHA